jgi:hypothetical protein
VTLGKQVASCHLAVAADLLALGLQLLAAVLTLHPKLLPVRHPVVGAIHMALSDTGLTFDTLRTRLVALHSRLALDTLRTRLVMLGTRLTFDTLRTRLMTLGARLTFGPLRTRLMTLGARLALGPLRTLGPLERGEMLLTLRARRLPLSALPLRMLPATAAVDLRRLLVLAVVRPRIRRGCDRQRGDAGCEKNPGHKLSPSNGENGPFATPFQRLNGWNLHSTALA